VVARLCRLVIDASTVGAAAAVLVEAFGKGGNAGGGGNVGGASIVADLDTYPDCTDCEEGGGCDAIPGAAVTFLLASGSKTA